MIRLPELVHSERLVLRHWRVDDVDAQAAAVAASAEHLRPFMPWIAREPLPRSARLEMIERWRREWEEGGDSVFGTFLDGAVVGSTGLHQRSGPGVLEIGYWVHVDHVRRGYATEASAALTAAAFALPGIDRVEIHHDAANTASSRVPARLGFTHARTVEVDRSAPGHTGWEWEWTLTRQEWEDRGAITRRRPT